MIADQRGIEIAVCIDLRTAKEGVIDDALLAGINTRDMVVAINAL